MILLIDNYDSFTFNLVHYMQELGTDVRVERNDALSVDDALALRPAGVVLSPGPGHPDDAGITLGLVAACVDTAIPLLGVCLGHQAIGQHFGGRVVRGGLMHGKVSAVAHGGTGVFAGLPSPFEATRYHSLVIEQAPSPLRISATSTTPGLDGTVIMGLEHPELPVHGVQFHPESIASQQGHALLANFLRLCGLSPCERAA